MELKIGQQIGSYKITQEIAHGQYAIIYKASHIILSSRIVALKFLYTTRVKTEEEFAQFFQEARILEQLQHPHILPVLDTNIFEQHPYTVTEFAAHGSLRDRLHKLRGKAMEVSEALEILRQIGEGLQFAHEHKIVHSDIKPENILFTASDSVRISDFDIARSIQRANGQTSSGGGTPAYMAPEQFQGKVRRESDQYALGCVAYELLTGRRPFQGSDREELSKAHQFSEPEPPSRINAQISSGLEQAILRAMARKYNERFESVAAFMQALADPLIEAKSQKSVGQEERLFLKAEGRKTGGGKKEMYDEKTIVGEESRGDREDPFAAPTVVDEKVPVKRKRVVQRVDIEKAEPVKKAERAGEEALIAKKAVKKVERAEKSASVVRKPASQREKAVGGSENGRERAVSVKKAKEEPAVVPAPKSAAMIAREAIMRPEEREARKALAEKQAVKSTKAETGEEKRVIVSRKRAAAKSKAEQ